MDTYIAIGSELMFIKEISGNNITVRRGEDGTTIDTHINGDAIDAVNAQDDALVEVGDEARQPRALQLIRTLVRLPVEQTAEDLVEESAQVGRLLLGRGEDVRLQVGQQLLVEL